MAEADWTPKQPTYPRFLLHYLEMVAAMFAGMAIVGLPLPAQLGLVGVDTGAWHDDAPALSLLWTSLRRPAPATPEPPAPSDT